MSDIPLMYMTRTIRLIVYSIFLTCLLWSGSGRAAGASFTDRENLLDKYYQIKTELIKSDFGIPIYIESIEDKNTLRGAVYGIIQHPFDVVQSTLRVPGNWCDIASLHLNIKACTYRRLNDTCLITFYIGRKFYQPPEATYQLKYEYRVTGQQAEFLSVLLTAENGPLHTKDHRIEFEAIPLDRERTLIHFVYAYSYGWWLKMAMKGYFATWAHDKVGFSVVGTDNQGQPIYVGGMRGAIERNSVRYYFAVQAYMDALKFSLERRFNVRLNQWYDLTDRYKRQLFEIEKEEYLQYKEKGRENQLKLQDELHRYPAGKAAH